MIPATPVCDPVATAKAFGFDSVPDYQQWHNLKVDGIAGPITLSSMLQPRCGRPDREQARGPEKAAWPQACMKVSTAQNINRLNVSAETIAQAWAHALELWNNVCGIELYVIDELRQAKIWARSGPLPGSTLAWSYLPNGNCSDRCEQRYDTTVNWNLEFLTKVILHELGHAVGLEHTNRVDDIMYPSIQNRPLADYPSANDVRRMVEFYGPNTPIIPPEEGVRVDIAEPVDAGRYTLKRA